MTERRSLCQVASTVLHERTAEVIALFETARSIGAMIDFELGEAQVWRHQTETSSQRWVSPLGSLGISGDGAHAVHEHILG
jgi:hypothetical protein